MTEWRKGGTVMLLYIDRSEKRESDECTLIPRDTSHLAQGAN